MDSFLLRIVKHLLQVGIIFVLEDGAVMLDEEVIQFGFGAHDSFEGAESLEVRPSDIGDETVVGFGYVHEFFDVPGMRGSHLDNRHLVRTRDT